MHGLGSPRASLTGDQRTSLRGFAAPRYFSAPHFLMFSRLARFRLPITRHSITTQEQHSIKSSLRFCVVRNLLHRGGPPLRKHVVQPLDEEIMDLLALVEGYLA